MSLPEDVRSLILEHIDSVEQLEVLLLLLGEPARRFTPAEVAQHLRIDTRSAASRLEDLHGRGFLSRHGEGAYQFDARSSKAPAVERLATVYRERRVTVITAIFTKPVEKIRTFADAFRIKKEPEE